jgi:mannose-1-phosphate guanylyltransferase
MRPPKQCVILVGGKASRLGKHGHSSPKPFLAVPDRPFVIWQMQRFVDAGIREFLFLAGHRADEVVEYVEDIQRKWLKDIKCEVCIEYQPLGTAGAVKNALPLLDHKFYLFNGDTYLFCNLPRLWRTHAESGCAATAALRFVKDTARYSIVSVTPERLITDIHEPTGVTEPGIVIGGLYILNKSAVKAFPDIGALDPALSLLAHRERLGAYFDNGYFIDIGILSDLETARTYFSMKV